MNQLAYTKEYNYIIHSCFMGNKSAAYLEFVDLTANHKEEFIEELTALISELYPHWDYSRKEQLELKIVKCILTRTLEN